MRDLQPSDREGNRLSTKEEASTQVCTHCFALKSEVEYLIPNHGARRKMPRHACQHFQCLAFSVVSVPGIVRIFAYMSH